jgi:hypothetical protein
MKMSLFSWASIAVLALIGGCSSSSSPPPPPPVDVTPPMVNTLSPADAAVDIDRFGNVSATFNEAMNAATVNATSFTIVDANGATVGGAVSFAGASNTATFAPDGPLSWLSQYTATLSTAVTDTAGNALAAPMVWSFTVADGSWAAAQQIDSTANVSNLPEQAIDVNGNVIAVWHQDGGTGIPDIWANRYSAANGTWSMPQLLENDPGYAFNYALSMDAAGNAIAVWDQETADNATFIPKIWARRYDATNDTWGPAEMISDSAGEGIIPSVAMDPGGSAIVVWEQDDPMGGVDIRASRYSVGSGTWSASALVENSLGSAFSPSIAMDASGNGIVVWEQEGVPDSFVFDISANRYSAATDTWGTQVLLETSALEAFSPKIAIQAGGDAVVIWEQKSVAGTFENDVRANVYSAGADAWDMAVTLDTAADDAQQPQVGIDAAGNATATWRQDVGVGENSILANRRPVGGPWGTAVLLENSAEDAAFPRLAVGVDGDSIVAWPQADGLGSGDLYVNAYSSAAGAWGTASVIDNSTGVVPLVRLATDAAGNAMAIWPQVDLGTAIADIHASRYLADTAAWSTPEMLNNNVSDDVTPPSLTMNANGVAAAAWQQREPMSSDVTIHGNQFE